MVVGPSDFGIVLQAATQRVCHGEIEESIQSNPSKGNRESPVGELKNYITDLQAVILVG